MQSAAPVANGETNSQPNPEPKMKGADIEPTVDEKKETHSSNDNVQEEMAMKAMPDDVNSMPPQQVYVNTPMMAQNLAEIENQFQAVSLGNAPPINGEGNDHNGDETNEGDPIKLFVGQVPKSLNEEDIFPVFDPFGPLKDVAIIRDKHTGIHRGCAFVTYWAAADAEKAQETLHGKFVFTGARRPAQVKPAEPSENKLFIGMLSRKAGEEEIRELFAAFGEIREIHMIRNADGSSKCAAFLRFVQRESAVQAIESLHNNIVMEGAARPLIVKFADNKHQRQQRHMRNVRRQEMMNAMGVPQGYPSYLPHQMAMPPHGGNPQFPMPPPYAAGFPGGAPPHGGPHHPFMYPPHQYGPQHPFAYPNRPDARPSNPRPREGPAGANLFVYHLPHDLTDADLATAFNPFGNVISAKVYVDKFTGESKGFGFVSYDSVMSAESAIEQMNGFQIGNKRLKVQHKRVHSNTGIPHNQHPHHPPIPPNIPPDAPVVQ